MPSFVARVERPERGGEWISYLESRARAPASAGRSGWASTTVSHADDPGPSVSAAARRRRRGRPAGGAAVRVERAVAEESIRDAVASLDADERAAAARRSRRRARQPPSPPRAGVRGAALPLRDRRRLRRVPRPAAPPDADDPVAVADARPRRRRSRAGRARRLRRRLPPRARGLAARVRAAALGPASSTAAPYALCLGYRIRFILDLNAREAMQLIELRSGREGHPSYRAVAHEMHAQIASVHPAVGAGDDARRPHDRAAARADPVRDAHPRPGGRALEEPLRPEVHRLRAACAAARAPA